MARARRSFTKEYKAEVVKLLQTSGKSPGVLARGAGADGDERAGLGETSRGR